MVPPFFFPSADYRFERNSIRLSIYICFKKFLKNLTTLYRSKCVFHFQILSRVEERVLIIATGNQKLAQFPWYLITERIYKDIR